jgi:Asp-tRNA(Asn)/Glu-tRNA(Gln) amidotransferase A subunit family amidase
VRLLDEAGAILLGKHAMHELAYGACPPPCLAGAAQSLGHRARHRRLEQRLRRCRGGGPVDVRHGHGHRRLGQKSRGALRLVGLKPSSGPGQPRRRDAQLLFVRSLRPVDALGARLRAGDEHRHGARSGRDRYSRPRCARRSRNRRLEDRHIAHLYERDLPANDEVAAECAMRSTTLERLGARIEEVSIAPLQQYAVCKSTIQHPEIREEYESVLGAISARKLQARMAIGRDISADDYLRAQRERRELTRAMHELFLARFDLLVTAGPYGPAR